MLQKGLGRSAEQNRGLGGDIRLKSGPYLVLFVLLHGGRPGSGRPRTFLENILPQERYQLVSDLYLQCLPCATQMHTRRDMAAYLLRALSGGIGRRRYLKGYDCGPNSISEKQRGTVLGSETIFLVSCHMTYKPPQADSPESYRITYVPCRAAMAPWLLRYPMCPKRALQFSLCFL